MRRPLCLLGTPVPQPWPPFLSLSDFYASILQTCLRTAPTPPNPGMSIHAHSIKSGLCSSSTYVANNFINFYAKSGLPGDAKKLFDEMPLRNIFSWNSVLSMHAKAGGLDEARQLFDEMPVRDSVSWTVMIVGYNHMGQFMAAIRTFLDMVSARFQPSHFTFSNVLSSCASLRCAAIGRKVHCLVVKMGMSGYVEVANSILNMYGKAGDSDTAKVVFDRMSLRSTSSWNTMISMHTQSGRLDLARQLFDQMSDRNVISWNSVIAGYNQNGLDLEALKFFVLMLEDHSVHPDHFTLTNVLSACANLRMLYHGKQVHAHMIVEGIECRGPVGNALISMYSKSGGVEIARKVVEQTMASDLDVISFTALLEGYVKLGDLKPARKIFDYLQYPDVVAWTAMIVGYEQNGLHSDAIALFRQMVRVGPKPNNYTLAAMLSVSSTLATVGHGKQIHGKSIRAGEELSVSVANALITMYAKCGDISAARRVFDKVSSNRQTVSWTSMIIALAQHGCGEEAIDLFEKMLVLNIKADHITYVGVISACTHIGLVEKGRKYFATMQSVQKIEPTSSHYACMIDLFARAGLFSEAQDFITKMPIEPDGIAWGSLLSACRVHKNSDLAKVAAERVLAIEPENSGAYSALANAYSACGRWEDAAGIWKQMRDRRVKKEQGFSWMQIKNTVHTFGADDALHPQRDQIFEMAAKIWKEIKKAGFVPDTSSVLHDIDDELKEELLSHHSEKLAIAFGLISTPENTTLRIMKNLRVCNDCHSAIKYISRVYSREIVVRDVSRFHHFSDARCSCRDFW